MDTFKATSTVVDTDTTNLPEITGVSDKQRSYGHDMRARWIREHRVEAQGDYQWLIRVEADGHLRPLVRGSDVAGFYRWMLVQDDARFWIDLYNTAARKNLMRSVDAYRTASGATHEEVRV